MKDDDFKLLKAFALGRMNERTKEQTFVIVESLSRLKKIKSVNFFHTGGGVRKKSTLFILLDGKAEKLQNPNMMDGYEGGA